MIIPGADKALRNLLVWASREEWLDDRELIIERHLELACVAFELDPEGLAAALGEDAYAVVLGSATEDFLAARLGDDDRNVIDDYLKRRGWREPVPAKRYLAALRDSVMSLYEVVDLVPNKCLVLRDLLRDGDPVEVDERLGSQHAAKWDRLALRLLPVNGRLYLSGSALHFPHEAADEVQSVFQSLFKKAHKAAETVAKDLGTTETPSPEDLVDIVLRDGAHAFTEIWLHHFLEQQRQPMPRVTNFDGNDIAFAEVRFPVHAGAQDEIKRRLDAGDGFNQDDSEPPGCTWLRPEPDVAVPQHGQRGLTFESRDASSRGSRGRLELRPEVLILNTNSIERAEAGKKLLRELLGGLVGEPLTSVQSFDSALAEHKGRAGSDEPEIDSLDPEAAKIAVRAVLDRHYRRCLDDPIPMLDDKSPRQAVRSKKGRENVAAWLKYLENGSARHPAHPDMEPYDFAWMWEELGIKDLRR